MSNGEIDDDAVFYHFPPVPPGNPGEVLRVTLGPPKSLAVNAVELGKLSPNERLDVVLECNCAFRLFGFKDKFARFYIHEIEKKKKILLVAVHPDKFPKQQKRANDATAKVNQSFDSIAIFAIRK